MSFGDTSDDGSSEQETKRVPYKNPATNKKEVAVTGQNTINKSIFRCKEPKCDKVYECLWQLSAHIRKIHETDNRNDDPLVEEPHCKRIKKVKKDHKCLMPGCSATFMRPYRLENHIATYHGGLKPFKCDYDNCDKSYTNRAHLKRHKVNAHLNEEDHSQEVICGEKGCGKVCSNKYNLKRHIATIHKQLPFECQICPEKFRRKSQLALHKIDMHNENAPYKCTKCTETFVHWNQYQKHINRHKSFMCDCQRSFDKWTVYLKHKRTECTIPKREYKCVICEKKFSLKQNLTQHSLKVHLSDSQNNDYKCPYLDCQHSYKYKKNLNFHIKSYHEKLFEDFMCTQENCQVVLKSRKNLRQHLRMVHSNQPLKEKTRRKPRKDKGLSKKSTASELSGLKVSYDENKKNLKGLFVNKWLNPVSDCDDLQENRQITCDLVNIVHREELKSQLDETKRNTESCGLISDSISPLQVNVEVPTNYNNEKIEESNNIDVIVEVVANVSEENIIADAGSSESITQGEAIIFDFPELAQTVVNNHISDTDLTVHSLN